MREAVLVMDLQFGSTGKGSLVGYLAGKMGPDTTIAAWGPNAGHTFVDEHGRVFIHTMLPIAAISKSVDNVLLGPGSVINWENLIKEVQSMNAQLERPRNFTMVVHPQAMVVEPRHLVAEKANVSIGSTMKGTGAALIEKIKRDPSAPSPLVRDMDEGGVARIVSRLSALGVNTFIDEDLYNETVDRSSLAFVEGAQGYSLGVHRQFWPYCTSREISPSQIMSDCALPLIGDRMLVYGTLRTFPIRVANRFNEKNEMIGTSGAWYADQAELSWDELGLDPEFTTVTKLKRRVFSFSFMQLAQAVRLCRPASLFLNFCNYLGVEDEVEQAQLVEDLCRQIDRTSAEATRNAGRAATVDLLGYGPAVTDIRLR